MRNLATPLSAALTIFLVAIFLSATGLLQLASAPPVQAADDHADVAALKGWRREVFGDDALRLRSGEVSLAVAGKNLKLVPGPL